MKKYFLFDDEPISGTNYARRLAVGSVLIFLLIGLWILAASGYKRAGAFGWKKEYKIIAAIVAPIIGIGRILYQDKGLFNSPFNLYTIITLLAVCFHFVMVVKNGNKNSRELITNILGKELDENLKDIKIKVKYIDNELHYQLKGNLVNPNEKLMLSQNLKFILLFEDESGNYILADDLPNKLFNENSNFYTKSGVISYQMQQYLPYLKFSKIAKCTIKCSE